MTATSAAEMRANARSLRARLFAPSNAVPDNGIDLHRKPPEPPPRPRITLAYIAPPAPPKPALLQPSTERKVRRLEVERLAKVVADYYDTPFDEVMSNIRTAPIVRVRHIACYLSHELQQRSYPEIARALKYDDHTSVMHAKRKIEALVEFDGRTAIEVAQLRDLIVYETEDQNDDQ